MKYHESWSDDTSRKKVDAQHEFDYSWTYLPYLVSLCHHRHSVSAEDASICVECQIFLIDWRCDWGDNRRIHRTKKNILQWHDAFTFTETTWEFVNQSFKEKLKMRLLHFRTSTFKRKKESSLTDLNASKTQFDNEQCKTSLYDKWMQFSSSLRRFSSWVCMSEFSKRRWKFCCSIILHFTA